MCGRYALELSGGELASLLGVTLGSAVSWHAAWNVSNFYGCYGAGGCNQAPCSVRLLPLFWLLASRFSELTVVSETIMFCRSLTDQQLAEFYAFRQQVSDGYM